MEEKKPEVENPKADGKARKLANLKPPWVAGEVKAGPGRPRDPPEVKARKEKEREVIRDLRQHAIQHTAEMFGITCDLARSAKNENVRLAAAESIQDRGHGKPVSIDVNGELQRQFDLAIERIKTEFQNEREILLRVLDCLSGASQ